MSSIEYINSATLTSDNVTGATFTSIPSNYTDLILVTCASMDTNHASILCRFNADTATNYSATYLTGSFSTTVQSTREANLAFVRLGAAVSYGSPANEQFTLTSHFCSYSSSSINKAVLSTSSQWDEVSQIAGLWRSTAAINQIQIYHPAAKFKAGSTFTLWGVK